LQKYWENEHRRLKKLAVRNGMDFEVMAKVSKCLHPDYTPTEAERAEAFRLFGERKDKGRFRR
jgi:hypothetical protein